MSTAPSEKHLEDWIEANPSQFCHSVYKFAAYQKIPLVDNVLFRQLQLSTGIVDLVGRLEGDIILVELKRDAIDEKAIIQLQRYINEVEQLIQFLGFEFFRNSWEFDFHFPSHVRGIIVGNRAKNQKVLSAIPAKIEAITYQYNDMGYSFELCGQSEDYYWYDFDKLSELANTKFGQFMKSIMMDAIPSGTEVRHHE